MAAKQLELYGKDPSIFHATDDFYTRYQNETGKIITIVYFTVRFT